MSKILVVDDSGYARRLLRQTLELRGHAVIEAGSGLAGLEAYAVHAPDLVLLDLTMEDLGGVEVLTRLKEIDPRIRVIVVSADIQRSTAKEVAAAGAFRFLGKPADPEELLEAVDAALSEAPR
ncbi:MAG TPA: response regulator [Longimicrobium sp.]|nr:response regulator [Longimicrobium sp.]